MKRLTILLLAIVFSLISVAPSYAAPELTEAKALALVKSTFTGVASRMVPGQKPSVILDGETAVVRFEVLPDGCQNRKKCGTGLIYNHLAYVVIENGKVVMGLEAERTAADLFVTDLANGKKQRMEVKAQDLPALPVPKDMVLGFSAKLATDQPMCKTCVQYKYVEGYYKTTVLGTFIQGAGGAACGLAAAPSVSGTIVAGGACAVVLKELTEWVPGYSYCVEAIWYPCSTPT